MMRKAPRDGVKADSIKHPLLLPTLMLMLMVIISPSPIQRNPNRFRLSTTTISLEPPPLTSARTVRETTQRLMTKRMMMMMMMTKKMRSRPFPLPLHPIPKPRILHDPAIMIPRPCPRRLSPILHPCVLPESRREPLIVPAIIAGEIQRIGSVSRGGGERCTVLLPLPICTGYCVHMVIFEAGAGEIQVHGAWEIIRCGSGSGSRNAGRRRKRRRRREEDGPGSLLLTVSFCTTNERCRIPIRISQEVSM